LTRGATEIAGTAPFSDHSANDRCCMLRPMNRSRIAWYTRRYSARLLAVSCVFCGEPTTQQPVCASCWEDMPWIAHACRRCGNPTTTRLVDVVCASCQQSPPPFFLTIAPLHYEFPLDAAIKALKFRRKLHLVPALSALVMPALAAHVSHFDALIPVPLYRWRHATRGFNQAQELARHVHQWSGLPVSNCVARTRRTAPQSGLDAVARRQNMREAFGLTTALACRYPLIVDDVMTTGETCRALATTLLDGGAERVGVLTIAHASP